MLRTGAHFELPMQITPYLKRFAAAALIAVAFAVCGEPGVSLPAAAAPQKLPVLTVTVFAAPSQVVWFPALIQATELDAKHGFKLEIKQKPSQIAYADFAAGADPVCYCISTGAGGRFVEQGADVALLWNIFNYDYYIVANSSVHTLKDLEGKTLVADTVTGSWALADWFLTQRSVDMTKVTIRSSNVRGAGGFAELIAGRSDAVAVTPIDASAVLADAEDTLHVFSVYDAAIWRRHARSETMPSITAGAWRDWAAKAENLDLLRRFYAANLDAAELVKREPEKAAALIEQGTGISSKTLLYYFAHFGNLIDIRPIADNRDSIAALTQTILPGANQLDRPFTAAELGKYVSDFRPQ
jgi:ABC-type nitrate/sulfonate/bicarbonate transport system substrate-binding protein